MIRYESFLHVDESLYAFPALYTNVLVKEKDLTCREDLGMHLWQQMLPIDRGGENHEDLT